MERWIHITDRHYEELYLKLKSRSHLVFSWKLGAFFSALFLSSSCVFCAIASRVRVNTSARTIYSPCLNSVHRISMFIRTHTAKWWLIPQMLSHTNTFSYTWFSLTTPTYFQSLPLCFSANGSNLLRNNKHHGVFNDGYYQWPCGKCQINIAMAVFVSVVLDKRSVPLHRGLCRMFASLPRSLLITFNLWRKNTQHCTLCRFWAQNYLAHLEGLQEAALLFPPLLYLWINLSVSQKC